ncbi:PTS system [Cutibacterium acnes JCM 18909]|nr:PTS system [Cutibacterium acnes JCM 18909]
MEELLWRKTLLPPAPRKKRQIPGFSQMQRIGRSLMLPIASLPVAALLMRFGSADVLGADGLAKHASWMQPVADVLAGAGGAIFDNLPLIFALGVAVGYAKKADGSTALAALVGYLTFTGAGTSDKTQGGVLHALAPYFSQKTGVINYGVLGGIVIGLIAAKMYEKYRRTKLPTYLASLAAAASCQLSPPPLPSSQASSWLSFTRPSTGCSISRSAVSSWPTGPTQERDSYSAPSTVSSSPSACTTCSIRCRGSSSAIAPMPPARLCTVTSPASLVVRPARMLGPVLS